MSRSRRLFDGKNGVVRLIQLSVVLVATLLIDSTAHAKVMSVIDLLSGGFEAGDTISEPVAVDLKPVEVSKQALKYNNGTHVDFEAKTTTKPIEVASTSTSATPTRVTTNSIKKNKDDDDLLMGIVPISTPSSSSSGSSSGSHAATTSLWTTTTSTFDYTTDTTKLQSELNTPEVTLSYMQKYFTYTDHYGNTPYDPATFNYYRTGDCKDYATFFGWALADDNWPVYTYDYQYGSSSGHVIGVYQGSDSNWYAQSNSSSIGPVGSVEDAISQTMPSGGTLGSYKQFSQGYTGTYSFK